MRVAAVIFMGMIFRPMTAGPTPAAEAIFTWSSISNWMPTPAVAVMFITRAMVLSGNRMPVAAGVCPGSLKLNFLILWYEENAGFYIGKPACIDCQGAG